MEGLHRAQRQVVRAVAPERFLLVRIEFQTHLVLAIRRLVTMKLRWIAVLAFWLFAALSLAMYRRYPWIDAMWLGAFLFPAIATSVYFVVDVVLHPRDPQSVNGYPRWFLRFAFDEKKPAVTEEQNSLSHPSP